MSELTREQAKELLMFHSGAHPNMRDARWTDGFLGSLRPYRGLQRTSFDEVMACLRTLAPDLSSNMVDREVLAALWSICHLARAWGLHPDGMLRRNHNISAPEIETLESWVEQLSYAVLCVLDGNPEEGFAEYDRERALQPDTDGLS